MPVAVVTALHYRLVFDVWHSAVGRVLTADMLALSILWDEQAPRRARQDQGRKLCEYGAYSSLCTAVMEDARSRAVAEYASSRCGPCFKSRRYVAALKQVS